MLTRADLLLQSCQAKLEAASDTEIHAALALLSGWHREADTLVRSFSFRDYHQTIDFVNAIAAMIHQEDHHPDLQVGYKLCKVSYSTHSVNNGKGGLSHNDFICAAKIDDIFAQRFS